MDEPEPWIGSGNGLKDGIAIYIMGLGVSNGTADLGRVDKLDSQIGFDLIQGSFCGGYCGAFADGRRRMGVL